MEQLKAGQQRPAAPRPRHYVLWQVLFALIFVTLILGGLELAARIRRYRKLGPKSLHPVGLRDRFTAWRNNPAYGRVDIEHNSQGFRRDRDVSVEKPPNTVRVFLLGGSAMYGEEGGYPEIDRRYSRIYNNQLIDYYLEQKLNQAFPRNYIFPLEIASLYRIAGEEKEAIREYEQVLEEVRRANPGYAEAPTARIHLALGELYSHAGEISPARMHLEQVPGSRGSTPEMEKQSAEMLKTVASDK